VTIQAGFRHFEKRRDHGPALDGPAHKITSGHSGETNVDSSANARQADSGPVPGDDLPDDRLQESAGNTGRALEVVRGVPPAVEALSFLARHFGRPIDPRQLMTGLPVGDGALSPDLLREAASRGGLAVQPLDGEPRAFRTSMLPALVLDAEGDVTIVLHRDADRFETADPRTGALSWLDAGVIDADGTARWYTVRPVFFFDTRSLLYYVEQPARWFWDTLKTNRNIYGWAILATVIVNLLGAAIPFYAMAVYDRVVPNNALDSLWVLTTAAVAFVLFDLVTKMLRSYLLDAAARRTDLILSSQVFSHSLRMRTAERPASGGVLANAVRDFESVREFFTASTLTLIGDLPFVVFYLVLIGLIGGKLVLIPIALVPLALGVAFYLQRPLGRVMKDLSRDGAQRTAHLFEVMNGIDTVKALGGETWARQRWEMLCAKIAERNLRSREFSSFSNYFSASLFALETILIVMFGAMLIAQGELTLGQLIACSMLASRAVAPVGQLAGLIIRWEQTKLSLEALEKIMKTPTDDKRDGLFVSKLTGKVELRDVEFQYSEKSLALRKVNLSVRPGEHVGFVGRVGSGKTTLLKLLLNIYEANNGTVLVDGIPVREYDPRALRRLIGYVPQDVVLFHGTIRENLTVGAVDATDEDLMFALRVSGLDRLLAQMPDGLTTEVGERGERLSGGQRQIVGLARALVRRPKLLLLDEPTSMMDPATEQQLIASLKANLPGTTLLLVTHRMAMLPLVERLVVMEQGQVVLDAPTAEAIKRLSGLKPAAPAAAPATRPAAPQPKEGRA